VALRAARRSSRITQREHLPAYAGCLGDTAGLQTCCANRRNERPYSQYITRALVRRLHRMRSLDLRWRLSGARRRTSWSITSRSQHKWHKHGAAGVNVDFEFGWQDDSYDLGGGSPVQPQSAGSDDPYDPNFPNGTEIDDRLCGARIPVHGRESSAAAGTGRHFDHDSTAAFNSNGAMQTVAPNLNNSRIPVLDGESARDLDAGADVRLRLRRRTRTASMFRQARRTRWSTAAPRQGVSNTAICWPHPAGRQTMDRRLPRQSGS